MHVTRKTNQELVILDSSIWISVLLLCVSAFVTYRLILERNQRGLLLVGFFLLFILLFWRKEVVVFDAARQQAIWTRRRLFKVATGAIPFSEITGIGMETSSSERALTYRLTILTAQGPTPMSDSYAGGQQMHENLRKEILDFLKLDSTQSPPAPSPAMASMTNPPFARCSNKAAESTLSSLFGAPRTSALPMRPTASPQLPNR